MQSQPQTHHDGLQEGAPSYGAQRSICFSVVSHGQGKQVALLLSDIARLAPKWLNWKINVVVTINVPEDEEFLELGRTLNLRVIKNPEKKGFGANHNSALTAENSEFYAVVNPDIRIQSLEINSLIAPLDDEQCLISAPIVCGSSGEVQDSARRFPTWERLAFRFTTRNRTGDYLIGDVPVQVDWVAGMFMVMRATAWKTLRGFDERYFMYLEDADLCRRAAHLGGGTVITPRARVIHDGQRASRRNWRHFFWHVRSATRFLSTRRTTRMS